MYVLFVTVAVLAVFLLVGGKGLLTSIGVGADLAGTISALVATVLFAGLLVAFAKYGIDWE